MDGPDEQWSLELGSHQQIFKKPLGGSLDQKEKILLSWGLYHLEGISSESSLDGM